MRMSISAFKKMYPVAAAAGLSLLPVAAVAQGNLQNVINLSEAALDVINIALVIVFVLAILVFGWGIVKYLTAAGDPTKVKEARGFLWWGILGVFVLAAMFGIVQFVGQSVGITTEGGGSLEPPGVTRPPAP
ncbi:MAG: hypothetical protein AAB533_00205 [Patescibacteria group bacterium]